jgi:hypothetical protein
MMTPLTRVMLTYGMMVNLSPEQEDVVRTRLEEFLRGRVGTDQELAVQGLKFLRGTNVDYPSRGNT